MRVSKQGAPILLIALSIYPGAAWAQALDSGEVTIRLVQGLDSSHNLKGISQGFVLKSTNPAIPKDTPALVRLASDPTYGGFNVELFALRLGARTVRVSSSAVETASDFLSKLEDKTRSPGSPRNSTSGTYVFLPARTVVRFTLTIAAEGLTAKEVTGAPDQRTSIIRDPEAEQSDGRQSKKAEISRTQPKTNTPMNRGSVPLSATSWTARPFTGRETAVPDAVVLGTSGPFDNSAKSRYAALLLGCEIRAGANVPVLRVAFASQSGIDVSRFVDKDFSTFVPMTSLAHITFDGFWGGRRFYKTSTNPSQTILQYDVDPRELGRFVAPDAQGQELSFDFQNFSNPAIVLKFTVPAQSAAIEQVLAACNVQPWSPKGGKSNVLSDHFSQHAIRAVQAVGTLRSQPGKPVTGPEAMNGLSEEVVTALEFGVANQIEENLLFVSSSEKGIPPRRARCVSALTDMLKTNVYVWPKPCSYVDAEAPQ